LDVLALAAEALAGSDGAAESGMARAVEAQAEWYAAEAASGAAEAVMALAAEAVSVDTRRRAVITER